MIPTEIQCKELLNNTTLEWTSINKVIGMKFINKNDSSKYIFIPAGGYFRDHKIDTVTYHCYCWTTILCQTLYISQANYFTGSSGRELGRSIRPVAPPKSQW